MIDYYLLHCNIYIYTYIHVYIYIVFNVGYKSELLLSYEELATTTEAFKDLGPGTNSAASGFKVL